MNSANVTPEGPFYQSPRIAAHGDRDGDQVGISHGLRITHWWNGVFANIALNGAQWTDSELDDAVRAEYPNRRSHQSAAAYRSYFNGEKHGVGIRQSNGTQVRVAKVRNSKPSVITTPIAPAHQKLPPLPIVASATEPTGGLGETITLFQAAQPCDHCFVNGFANRGQVHFPQPRWIGQRYFSASPRVAIVMVNPGDVGDKTPAAGKRLEAMLINLRSDQSYWQAIMDYLIDDMPKWGNSPGAYTSYLNGLGISLETTAIMNLALCGAKTKKGGNAYPTTMIDACWKKHTKALLRLLNPDICILGGNAVQQHSHEIRSAIPRATIIAAPHYACRDPLRLESGVADANREIYAAAQRRPKV